MVTRRDDLELSRTRLIAALDAVEPGDIPKISKELRAVNLELENLGGAVTPGQALVDELKKKRERRSKATG